MKKLGIWIALFLATIIGALVGWDWHTIHLQPQVLEASYQTDIAQIDALPLPPDTAPISPMVNGDRLMADVRALAFNRFTDSDRSRARSYIVRQLHHAGWTTRTQMFDSGINIYAERAGTDPRLGAILVASHYDTVATSPGADDNATGVATVLETARLLGDRPTPRPLKVALFDQEEEGLVGSFAFAADPLQTNTLAGVIILEMIGFTCNTDGCQHYPSVLPFTPSTNRGDFLAVIGDQGHMPLIDAFSHASTPNLPMLLTLPVPLLGPFTPDLLRSDHAPFWQKGIGAVMLTDTANFRNPHYHQPTDTVDTLDASFFAGSAQITINAITALLHNPHALTAATSAPQNAPSPPLTTTPL